MAAEVATASDQLVLSASKTLRDFRLSLALVVAGIAMVVGYYLYAYWARVTGHYPTSAAMGVIPPSVGEVGTVLILVGGIFAGVNWSLLRKSRPTN